MTAAEPQVATSQATPPQAAPVHAAAPPPGRADDPGGGKAGTRALFRRMTLILGAVAVLIYAAWLLGPYVRSIFVRDATVTSWMRVSTSPIQGSIDGRMPPIGHRMGPSGQAVKVVNHRYDTQRLVAAQAATEAARVIVAGFEAQLGEERQLNAGRRDMKSAYAARFKALLDDQIRQAEQQVGMHEEQLTLLRGLLSRRVETARAGYRSSDLVDEERVRFNQVQIELYKLRASLAQAKAAREAAEEGVFMDLGGDDPSWVLSERVQTRRAIEEVRQKLIIARAELARAEVLQRAEQERMEREREGWVTAAPGATVRSSLVGDGATVAPGAPVLHWLDCNVLFIDAPVPDAMVALIRPGMAAEVVLEGETRARTGRVFRTRGGADTLGRSDLAAVATGRRPGIGQVLIDFDVKLDEFTQCPVGRAAFVQIPDVGILDVAIARLRLPLSFSKPAP